MKLSKLFCFLGLLLAIPLMAQTYAPTYPPVTVTGTSFNVPNGIGAINTSFEEIPTGSPATVSVTIQGCMRGNTCDAASDTNTATSATIRGVTFAKPYGYFKVTVNWTGGTNVTFTINPFLTFAKSSSGGSGGAVASVFGRTGAVVGQGGDYTVAQITGAAPLDSPVFTTANTFAPGTFKTSGTANASQSVLNFIASSVNAAGLTITPSNPATSSVKFEITGNVNAANGGTGADLSAAASGRYPKATGTGVFAASTLAAAGIGSCINQVITSANADAAPTCATVTPAMIGTLLSGSNGLAASATIDTTNAANISSGLLSVARGGIGVSTLAVHGILIGQAASAVTALAPAADSVPLWQSSGVDPTVTAINNCGDTTHGLSYSTSTHTFGCQSIPGNASLIIQTNGVGNTLQTTLNFITSTANTNGITITPSNPATGNEKLEATCANCVLSSSPGAGIAHFAGGTQTVTSSAVNLAGTDVTGLLPLTNIAAQAADTLLANASGSSASPAALAFPTSGTNGCAGVSNALIYNTSTHAFGCNVISGSGTVTSASFTGGLISVGTPTTTPAFTVAGTSGGIPYFSGAATWASSAALIANLPVLGGGAGVAPSSGTVTGNTTQFATWSGATTASRCVHTDASGNLIVAAADCGTAGVSSFTGDGTIINNSSSTGAVTATLANAGAGTLLGNATGSAAAPSYTATPLLGLPGTTVGTLGFANATSGTITLSPVAGALGTKTLTLPALTDTLAVLGTAQTFTAAQTFPNGTAGSPSVIVRSGVGIGSYASTDLSLNAPATSSIVRFIAGSTTIINLGLNAGGATFAMAPSNTNMNIQGTATTSASTSSVILSNTQSHVGTSGQQYQTESRSTFAPTSGTGTYVGFISDPTINQTGGANGAIDVLGAFPVNTALVGSENCLSAGTSSASGASGTLTRHFTVDCVNGDITLARNGTFSGTTSSALQKNSGACNARGTAASPSVVTCGASASGMVYCDVAASGGVCRVNTTAITTNSVVIITSNTSDATALGGGVTCNASPSVVPAVLLAAKVNATSFDINEDTGITNGFCYEYSVYSN